MYKTFLKYNAVWKQTMVVKAHKHLKTHEGLLPT